MHVLRGLCAVVGILVVTLASAGEAPRADLTPVILVPGMGSTQLEVKVVDPSKVTPSCVSAIWPREDTNWHRLWVTLNYFLPGETHCFVRRMSLQYGNDTVGDLDNLESRVTGWGNTSSIELLDPGLWPPTLRHESDVFYPVAQYLVDKLGYERGVTLRGAPYDFRLMPHTRTSSGQRDVMGHLKELVEETYQSQGSKKVMLVSHSMGGNYALAFLRTVDQDWKDKHLAGWISVGTVFGGSILSLTGVAAGWNEHVVTVPNELFKTVQRTWETMWWLAPRLEAWDPDEVLITSPSHNYSLGQDGYGLRDAFVAQNYTGGYDFFMKRARDNFDPLTPVGVPVHCFYSTGVDTMKRLDFAGDDMSEFPTIVYDKVGDGSVNERSLELCKKLGPASVNFYTGIEHLKMIHTPEVIEAIGGIIKNASSTSLLPAPLRSGSLSVDVFV